MDKQGFRKIKDLLLREGSAHDPEQAFLSVQGLYARYDGFAALENLNFEIDRGDQVALVGPNGAGKSTLFKVMAGVMAPSKGSVKVYGQLPAGHICIAYLPQSNQVDWRFPATVRDVVMMGRISKMGLLQWPRKQDWQFVHTCLEKVNLQNLALRQIEELSGGQRQRMFIARALAQEAELVMMDEPLNGLDAPSREEVFDIFKLLKEQGVSVIVATHDLGLATERFEKAILLNHSLIAFGKPEEIFTENNLNTAYGDHIQVIQTGEGVLFIEDTCCP